MASLLPSAAAQSTLTRVFFGLNILKEEVKLSGKNNPKQLSLWMVGLICRWKETFQQHILIQHWQTPHGGFIRWWIVSLPAHVLLRRGGNQLERGLFVLAHYRVDSALQFVNSRMSADTETNETEPNFTWHSKHSSRGRVQWPALAEWGRYILPSCWDRPLLRVPVIHGSSPLSAPLTAELTLWPTLTNFSILRWLGRAPKCHFSVWHGANWLPRRLIKREMISVCLVCDHSAGSALISVWTYKLEIRPSVLETIGANVTEISFFGVFFHHDSNPKQQTWKILKWNLHLHDLRGNSKAAAHHWIFI